MFLKVDFKNGVPAYLQIVDQVKRAAASGALQAGDSLPPIRSLAEKLSINRNTVAKAYSELEAQDVIEAKVGRGCVIAANQSPLRKAVRQGLLDEVIDAAIIQAHHLQIGADEFQERVEQRIAHFQREQQRNHKS